MTGGRDPARDYYLRVRPVVGEVLLDRRLAVWDLGFGYLAAEALARTGLRRQRWYDEGQAGGAFCRSLGWHHGGRPRAAALAALCAGHNTFESDWQLAAAPPHLDELRRHLREETPDLLLARIDGCAGELARAAVAAGVPFVMTGVPAAASPSCVQVVWAPESTADPGEVIACCAALARVAQLDLDRAEAHLDGLEARSLSLALARWLLLRGSSLARRPDLEGPLLVEGRAILLRGHLGWPWAVGFLTPGQIPRALAGGAAGGRYLPPLALTRRQRLLVIGLGTGSLFCAEAGHLFQHLTLIDCKAVAAVNPVRQVYGTRHIGQPKAEALSEILAERLDPGGSWTASSEGPLHLRRGGAHTLAAAQLRLSARDPEALVRFREILDHVRPDLAVVAMGRGRDDNFLATQELRRRGIRHLTPSAFPGVTHFKHILTDGAAGPCYDCLQGHLAVDGGPAPTLSAGEREVFYGGSQPATLAETYPSAHSLLRLAGHLALPASARPAYLTRELARERNCLVGANRAERAAPGGWLYGVDRPFAMVSYGVADVVDEATASRCSCGRRLGPTGGPDDAPAKGA